MGLDYRAILQRIPLFTGLESADLAAISQLATTRRYRAKQVIVQQQDPGGELFVLLNGHTKVVTSDPDGRDTALGLMGPGEVFGEVSLLDEAPRSATIIALGACELLVLRREPFIAFLEQRPKIAIRLLGLIAGRLRQLTTRSEDIAFLTVAARLAKCIVQLADEYGRGEGSGVRVEVKLSQQEIGDLIGATRESANKHIRAWEQRGIVSQRSGHLIVHDLPRLREIAECSDHNLPPV